MPRHVDRSVWQGSKVVEESPQMVRMRTMRAQSARQNSRSHGALGFLQWRDTVSYRHAILDTASPFGAYLAESELKRLAKACSILKVSSGHLLPESPFYVVLEGCVEIVVSSMPCLHFLRTFQCDGPAKTPNMTAVHMRNGCFSACLVQDIHSGEVLTTRGPWSFFSRRAGQGVVRGEAAAMDTLLTCREVSRILLVTSEDRLERFYW